MAWLMISSGRGPEECEKFVDKFITFISKEHDITLLEYTETKHGMSSAIISGDEDVLKNYCGTLQWIWKSSIRPNHKRKNWFITAKMISENIPKEFDINQIEFKACTSSGPGGQHVNKTASAIRATYKPLNITVFAQEERSQRQNKKLAIARIIDTIHQSNIKDEEQSKSIAWTTHNQLKRGDAIKIFYKL